METKHLPQKLIDDLSAVKHPAIDFSLIELGILKEISIDNKTANVTIAFPFPNIPIEGTIVNSIKKPFEANGYEIDYSVVIMTEQEKNEFLGLEKKGWKGL